MDIKIFINKIRKVALRQLYCYNWAIPDKTYLRLVYYLKNGEWLNLEHPQTYNEKLNWLKLHDKNPLYTSLVDKYSVKELVSKIVGDDYVIPTIGVWDRAEDIEWESLPSQFVLKTTHGGGNNGVVICKDKASFNILEAVEKLNKSMKQAIYKRLREWPYKNVPKKIIAEQYMEDSITHDLRDYKFFCFNGKVRALFIATDRGSGNVKFDYYDEAFNHLDLVQQHPMSGKNLPKPVCFDEMKIIAEKLSTGFPQVRIDLYEVNGKVLFGEYTFFHHGGVVPFHPKSWDFVFGSWIKLPVDKVKQITLTKQR